MLIFSISPLTLACFWFSSCLCFAFHVVSTHVPHTAKKNTQINLCLNKQILNRSFTYKWCQGFKLFHLLLYACRVHFASGWGIQFMDPKATVTQQPLQPQMLLLPVKQNCYVDFVFICLKSCKKACSKFFFCYGTVKQLFLHCKRSWATKNEWHTDFISDFVGLLLHYWFYTEPLNFSHYFLLTQLQIRDHR